VTTSILPPKKKNFVKLRAQSGENINLRFTLNNKQLHNPTQRIYKKHQKKLHETLADSKISRTFATANEKTTSLMQMRK
jgi:hypothetical protein